MAVTEGRPTPRRAPRRATALTSDETAVVTAMRSVFPGLDVDVHAAALATTLLQSGDVLCRAGDDADVAWIVARGRLRVMADTSIDSDPAARVPHHLTDVGPGVVIGEAALIEGGRRTATVVARRDTLLITLTREWIAEFVAQEPGAMGHVIRSLSRHQAWDEPTERVITLVPAGADPTATGLLAALEAMPGAVVVDADHADPDDDVSARWLSDLETSADRVVLLADPTWTAWTDRAVRLADRVVTIVDASEAVLHDTETRLAALPEVLGHRHTSVFVHAPETAHPRGTRELLARRPGTRHLHARAGHERDLARVARHLTGRAVALVVSGGGARSLAAVGVHRELRRRGVPIDAVTGSSAGAVIAAVIAQDADPDDLLRRSRSGFRGIRDPTIPMVALLRGRRLWDKLGEHLGDGDIEDTWIPFACTSTDLTDQVLVEHVSGSLRLAVRASVSLPGVFSPIDIDGHLHVDGGVLDNVPIHAAEALAPGATIIAVDTSPPVGQTVEAIPPAVSGTSVLARRLLRRSGPAIPSIAMTVTQSTLLSATQARKESVDRADCHIDLDLGQVSLLDFGKIDRVIDQGDHQSVPLINAWLAGSPVELEEPWNPSVSLESALDGDLATTRGRAILGSLTLAVADLRFRLRRFVVAMVAAAVVLALLLLMTGVVNQLDREPSATADTIGATTWLLPEGIRSPFTSNASFDKAAIHEVVTPANKRNALIARLPLTIAGETIDAILVGHGADGPGVPDATDGRSAASVGEVAVSTFAGAQVGDVVGLGGTSATVVGTIADTTLFAGMPIAFVPIDVARSLVAGGRPVASAVLVDGEVTTVPAGLHALHRSEIVAEAKGPVERPILTLHLVQVLLGIVAAMIIGAVVYLATLERTRDIAVLRAVGTTGGMLALGVAAQALVVAAVAAILAIVLEKLLSPVFPLTVHLTVADLVALPVIAAIVAVASSYVAIRRTLRIDPSEAFAGAGG